MGGFIGLHLEQWHVYRPDRLCRYQRYSHSDERRKYFEESYRHDRGEPCCFHDQRKRFAEQCDTDLRQYSAVRGHRSGNQQHSGDLVRFGRHGFERGNVHCSQREQQQ